MNKYKTAITYGTFDILHVGHINLLQRIKNISEQLIVGVCSDEFCASKVYKKYPVFSTEERVEIVSNLKFVDKVIVETHGNQKIHDILKYDVDLFVVGDDWNGFFEHLREYCDVLYLERTPHISSSDIKDRIKQQPICTTKFTHNK